MLIDFHTHAYPDALAKKAVASLTGRANVSHYLDGTAGALIASTRNAGFDCSVLLNIVVKPEQTEKALSFARSFLPGEEAFSPNIISFASLHPDDPDWRGTLRRIKTDGFLGIKLHPEYQDFFIDDPKMEPIYRELAALNLIAVFHCGVDTGFQRAVRATPQRILNALPLLERCRTVLAHMGGHRFYDDVLRLLCGRDVYLDTAFVLGIMDDGTAREIVRRHGYERILFGSDSPWQAQAVMAEHCRRVFGGMLSPAQLGEVFGGNAAKLLKQGLTSLPLGRPKAGK